MTQGVVRERLGFDRAGWDALPWHERRGYLEYLAETAEAHRAGQGQQAPPPPAVPPAPSPPAERGWESGPLSSSMGDPQGGVTVYDPDDD